MPLIHQTAPHLSAKETARTIYCDVLIALLPLIGMAYYYYGLRALLHIAIGIVTACAADWVCVWLAHRGRKPDLSPIITGTLVPLLLPAAASYRITIIGVLFAVIVVKQAFGGLGNNLFNPAAGGMAFVTACFPTEVIRYTAPFARLGLWTVDLDAVFVESPAAILSYGGTPTITGADLLLGNYAGPMGTTNLMVVFAAMLYLAVRKALNFRIPLFYTISVVLFAALLPRIPGIGMLDSVLYEIGAGTVLFYGFYLVSEPVTAPRTNAGKCLYGFFGGLVVMLFRYFGAFLIAEPFAILLINAMSIWMDRLMLTLRYGTMPRDVGRRMLKGFLKPPRM